MMGTAADWYLVEVRIWIQNQKEFVPPVVIQSINPVLSVSAAGTNLMIKQNPWTH